MDAIFIGGLNEQEQTKLREALLKLKGPARKSAEWAIRERWGPLCEIADFYARDEPLGETWRDAERQWKRVEKSAHELNEAVKALGELALAAPQNFQGPVGQAEEVEPFIHQPSGSAFIPLVHDLEWYAKAAVKASQAMKAQCNGAQRDSENGQLAFLIHRLFGLLQVPNRPQAHIQRIAAAIHGWAFPKDLERALMDPRFGERALNRVRRHTRTPHP